MSVFLTCPGWKGHSHSYILTSFDHFLPCGNLSFCKSNSFHHNFIRNVCKFFQLTKIAQQNEKKTLGFFSALKPQYQTKLKMTLLSVALPLTHSLTIALWDAPQWPHRISHKKLCWDPKLGYASQNFFNQHATCTAIAEAKWMDSSFSMLVQFSPGGRLTWWWR